MDKMKWNRKPPSPKSRMINRKGQNTFFCTFLCRYFSRLQHETSRNFLVTHFVQEMSYMFSFTLFSLLLIFTFNLWPLAFFIFSKLLQNFHVVLPTKKFLVCFFSHSRSLPPFFLLSFVGLLPTLSFSFSLALYSKFVDMTINLSLTP